MIPKSYVRCISCAPYGLHSDCVCVCVSVCCLSLKPFRWESTAIRCFFFYFHLELMFQNACWILYSYVFSHLQFATLREKGNVQWMESSFSMVMYYYGPPITRYRISEAYWHFSIHYTHEQKLHLFHCSLACFAWLAWERRVMFCGPALAVSNTCPGSHVRWDQMGPFVWLWY